MSDKWIRASEIAEYVYCRRAWWLRHVAGEPVRERKALKAGTAFHEAHGRLVQSARWARALAYVLVALAAAVVAYGIVLAL